MKALQEQDSTHPVSIRVSSGEEAGDK